MSLNPGDSSRRGRSKSPGRDDDWDRSRGRYEEEVRESSRTRVEIDRAPSPPRSRYDDDRDTRKRYDYEEETVIRSSRSRPEREETKYTSSRKYISDSESSVSPDEMPARRTTRASPERRPSRAMPGEFKETVKEEVKVRYDDKREKEYYEERKYSKAYEPESPKEIYTKTTEKIRYAEADPRDRDFRRYEEETKPREREASINVSGSFSIGHGDSPKKEYARPASPKYSTSYADPKKYEYAHPEEKISYTTTSRKESYSSRPSEPSSYGNPRSSDSKIVTVEPGQRRTSESATIQTRLGTLSVSTGHSQALTLASAPGSPLLEAYRGTYQSISPMPSPLMIATSRHGSNVDVAEMTPLSPTSSRTRHARFHDMAADATRLAKALKGNKSPDIDPLIEILPALTHEQILDLRVEYKKLVKTGPEKKGVNIAKHIKLRLKEEESPLLKACYAVALGQWESEAYWANFWYQGEKSRRELLIESLMGRTNEEIAAIKDGFSDKKYSDSLVKCMKMELKEDKFKKAVLLILEERRMEDHPYSINRRQVEDDVRELHKAVKAEKGGETTMIQIIVLRSDSHIREILKVYEASFKANFAREMLKKSGNLVVCISSVTCVRNLTPRRASSLLIFSMASSTVPSVTPYSSITRCPPRNLTHYAPNFLSLALCVIIGIVRTWKLSSASIGCGMVRICRKRSGKGLRAFGVSSVSSFA